MNPLQLGTFCEVASHRIAKVYMSVVFTISPSAPRRGAARPHRSCSHGKRTSPGNRGTTHMSTSATLGYCVVSPNLRRTDNAHI